MANSVANSDKRAKVCLSVSATVLCLAVVLGVLGAIDQEIAFPRQVDENSTLQVRSGTAFILVWITTRYTHDPLVGTFDIHRQLAHQDEVGKEHALFWSVPQIAYARSPVFRTENGVYHGWVYTESSLSVGYLGLGIVSGVSSLGALHCVRSKRRGQETEQGTSDE